MAMNIAIKNMVCPRCIKAVRELLTSMNLNVVKVELGYAVLGCEELDREIRDELSAKLHELGFELLADNDVATVERVKIAILRLARKNGGPKIKLSQALEECLKQPYKTLATIFSQIEGRTIESYFILQRIEYVKELISYGELTLAEIAFRTGYSSVAYLSKQFAQVVGMTISEYRKIAEDMRTPLSEI
jgi:AraC-like DNA-binding protein